MRRIFKYPLGIIGGIQQIEMPAGAQVLHFGRVAETTNLWVLVDMMKFTLPRRFIIYGTGHEFLEGAGEHRYVGTITIGAYVWHCFEVV